MWEGTTSTSRVMAADRPYREFYDFYMVSSEYFGYTLVSCSLDGSGTLPGHLTPPPPGMLVGGLSFTDPVWTFREQTNLALVGNRATISWLPSRRLWNRCCDRAIR
jgi:hypothetical protein